MKRAAALAEHPALGPFARQGIEAAARYIKDSGRGKLDKKGRVAALPLKEIFESSGKHDLHGPSRADETVWRSMVYPRPPGYAQRTGAAPFVAEYQGEEQTRRIEKRAFDEAYSETLRAHIVAVAKDRLDDLPGIVKRAEDAIKIHLEVMTLLLPGCRSGHEFADRLDETSDSLMKMLAKSIGLEL